MEIKVVNDEVTVANESVQILKNVVAEKPNALIVLPAGNTAILFYEKLAKCINSGEIDISKVTFMALDEWLDISDKSNCCGAFLEKHLLDKLEGFDKTKFLKFSGESVNANEECVLFDKIILDNGGVDLMFLGLGMNGHLGLNEPYSSFDNYTTIVNLDDTTKSVGQKYFDKNIKLSRGITIGIKHILEARKVVLQVIGESKKDIVKKVIDTEPTEEIPATALKLTDNSLLLVDKAAVS